MDDIERVIEIKPDGKYILIVPQQYTIDDIMWVKEKIDAWMNSDSLFMVVGDAIQLQRVDE